MPPPPKKSGLIKGLLSLNKALLGSYFLGGWHWGGGGTLGSHDSNMFWLETSFVWEGNPEFIYCRSVRMSN